MSGLPDTERPHTKAKQCKTHGLPEQLNPGQGRRLRAGAPSVLRPVRWARGAASSMGHAATGHPATGHAATADAATGGAETGVAGMARPVMGGDALRPVIRLNPGQGRRLRAGAPWVFSNEIAMKPEYRGM